MRSFGDELRFFRQQQDMSQQDFAVRMEVSSQHQSDLENGRRMPSVAYVERLCEKHGRGRFGREHWHVLGARAHGWKAPASRTKTMGEMTDKAGVLVHEFMRIFRMKPMDPWKTEPTTPNEIAQTTAQRHAEEALNSARAAENEACARILENYSDQDIPHLIKRIRSRIKQGIGE